MKMSDRLRARHVSETFNLNIAAGLLWIEILNNSTENMYVQITYTER